MRVAAMVAGLGALLAGQALAQDAPDWVARIRPDHPRVFLNADGLPEVRALAQGPKPRSMSARATCRRRATGARTPCALPWSGA